MSSPQWPLITFSYIHSLRWDNLQQNGMSYAILYSQQPEIDSGDQDFTSSNHLFWSRLSPLKGFGPPKAYSSVERFHNDCAYSSLGHYIDDKSLLLDISWNIAVFLINKGFLGDCKGP